jgi:hypothetical protein|tara:strand:+ start:66 stop:536 length:471 start_codon:yes stop_codon:yes gene_type:complete
MKLTPRKIKLFLLFKLPSAFFSGVRVKSISADEVVVRVRHCWINQNPFKSLYWATQGMASELATGILVMQAVEECKEKFSTLVTQQKGAFTKKATGNIVFSCKDSSKINDALTTSIKTGEGQIVLLKSNGFDEAGDCVSSFEYEWSVKVRSKSTNN